MKTIPVGRDAFALVDDADYERLAAHRWQLHPGGYAMRKDGKRTVYMHREVMDAPGGVEVDHRNLDKRDNRRENLRFATRLEQARNRPRARYRAGMEPASQFRGVTKRTDRQKKWRADLYIGRHGVVFLGYYATEEEAARAYDAEAIRRFGADVRTNLPQDGAA
jgi:hypothetical protein